MTNNHTENQALSAHPDSDLSEQDLLILHQLLIEKRDELLVQSEGFEKEITRKEDCSLADAVEASFYRAEANRAEVQLTHNHSLLNEIARAFLRLETAQYGVSIETGDPIPFARLQLLPWTDH
ncbi:TraR/DksA family transcriptional regulator [Enterovibrio sp. FF113]|uniref:TraR/DksA family transcriptional regulator n=1 Tax=Enterovibrio sp. FF113 TaxID=3230010 RepID=UPI00352EFCD1